MSATTKQNKEKKEKAQPVRHKTNPFLKNFKPNTRSKTQQLRTNKIYKLVDNDGQELKTSIYMHKQVETAEYLKLYATNIAMLLDLKADAVKAFVVVLYILNKHGKDKDLLELDKYELDSFFDEFNVKKFSPSYFKRGLNSLVKAGILAHGIKKSKYYCNPKLVFNGNRLALITVLEQTEEEEQEEEGQEEGQNSED